MPWEDEYVRVTPGECATIIRKTLEELFVSSDFCGSNLHNQLPFLQVDHSPSEQTLGCPYKPTSHGQGSLSWSSASLQPPWEPGMAGGNIPASPGL